MPKTKNILIFLAIAVIFVLAFLFFTRQPVPVDNLVSSLPPPIAGSTAIAGDGENIAQDFLNLLLSVKDIKLTDTIFSDNAFASLHDSSITLVPDGTEGRPNPFAPLGSEISSTP